MILNNRQKRCLLMGCFKQREKRALLDKVSCSPCTTGQHFCGCSQLGLLAWEETAMAWSDPSTGAKIVGQCQLPCDTQITSPLAYIYCKFLSSLLNPSHHSWVVHPFLPMRWAGLLFSGVCRRAEDRSGAGGCWAPFPAVVVPISVRESVWSFLRALVWSCGLF